MRSVFADRYPDFRLEGGAPLTIFAALDESTAKSLEPALWRSRGAKPAGVFHHAWEKEYVMVQLEAWKRGALEIVYHEYTHSILHLNLHWIPVWLDEGIANFYGYTRFKQHKIYIGAPPQKYKSLVWPFIPVETLISVDQRSPFYRDEDKVYRFYTESWGLVHFLMIGPGMDRAKGLNQFASLLQQGIDQKKAFQQVFGDFKELDRALDAYLSNFAFRTGVLPESAPIDEKSFSSRTLTLAETEAELGGFHLWTHDLSAARRLVEQALKHEPGLGIAHEAMGFLDFSEGKDAEALDQFSQAFAADPTLSLSLFAKTMLSPVSTSDAPADLRVFHDSLEKVLAQNPQFGPAYVQLARLWLRKGDLTTALAVSRRAEQLEPMRAGYHLLSGQILLRMGKGTEAATFAKFVAQRWTGPDHDEAVELWNAVPAEQRPPGDDLSVSLPKDIESTEGLVKTVQCSAQDKGPLLTINHDGQSLNLRSSNNFAAGFSDTIWYGQDHFNLCHHLEGKRAIARYRPAPDGSYTGELSEIEIRDDFPGPPKNVSEPAKP
jgi:Tfp pilus assembly protein PilF